MTDVEPKIGAGMSTASKVAKGGSIYWRDNGWFVFLSMPGQKRFRLDAKSRTYDEMTITKNEKALWYSGASDPQIFAEKPNLEFGIVGNETVNGHNCIKIRATPKKSPPKGTEAVYFYAAQDLKNLIIKTELKTAWRTTTYLLSEISFNPPKELFQIPADYRKSSN